MCKILIIDTENDLRLLQEVTSDLAIPVQIKYTSSISEAMELICTDRPDIILIGSGKLMEDFEILIKSKDIPIVILCESDGFGDFLLMNSLYNVLFVTRPFDMDDIPEVFQKAFEFWTKQKEKS